MQWHKAACQLVWHTSTEEQGRHFTLNTAAVHWCMVTTHLYAEWVFIAVNEAAVSWFGTAAQKNKAGSLPLTQQKCTGVW